MEATSQRDWSSLPVDLLRDILARLPWSSHPCFAATCTHWRTIVSPFYPAWLTPRLLNAVDVGSTNVRYYSPYHQKIFEVDQTLRAPDARIHGANGRQLTLCYRAGHGHDDDRVRVVHADLVTGDTRELPPLETTFIDFVVGDGDRMVLGIQAAGIIEAWRSFRLDDGDDDDVRRLDLQWIRSFVRSQM